MFFSQDGSGSGAVLALNGDGTLNSADGCLTNARPARTGDLVQLFGMGEGVVSPAVAAGQAAPSNPASTTLLQPTVTLTSSTGTTVQLPVVFSGAAPGYVGVWQVNVTIPAGAPSGPNVPLTVTFRGQTTSQFLTLSVNTATIPCSH